jgi:hypothetical protein
MPDRAVLNGIVVMQCSGIAWNPPSQEMGCGSGIACWGDWLHGKRPASGNASTRRRRRSDAVLANSTWHAPLSTVLRLAQWWRKEPAGTQRIGTSSAASTTSSSTRRHPACGHLDCGELQRHHATRCVGRSDASHSRITRTASVQTEAWSIDWGYGSEPHRQCRRGRGITPLLAAIGSLTAVVSIKHAGSSNVLLPDFTHSGGSGFAMNDAHTCMRHSSRSRAARSAATHSTLLPINFAPARGIR